MGGGRKKLIKLFSTSVSSQVLLSGTSFLVNLLLIRYTSDTDYGLFILAQSAILLAITAQNSWMVGPLIGMAGQRQPEPRRQMIGAIFASSQRFLTRALLILMPLAGIGYAIGRLNGLEAVVVAITLVAAWTALRRDFTRNLLLSYARPLTVLRADLFYVALMVSGVVLASASPDFEAAIAVAGLTFAAWIAARIGHEALAADPGWVVADAAPYWKEMRSLAIWATTGAVIFWLFSQSYNYILAARVDLTAVADVNASRMLLMPAMLLTTGVRSLLGPMSVTWLTQLGLDRLLKRLAVFVVGIGVLQLIYFAALWLFRDWLTGDLMHREIGDRDRLIMLWAGVSLVSLCREVTQCAVQAMLRFEAMAYVTAASALMALVLMWFGLDWWGPAAVIIAQIAGEFVMLVGVLVMLVIVRRERQRAAQVGVIG